MLYLLMPWQIFISFIELLIFFAVLKITYFVLFRQKEVKKMDDQVLGKLEKENRYTGAWWMITALKILFK